MQKGVLAGVGAGILVLTFIGGYWFANQSVRPVPNVLPEVAAGSAATNAVAESAAKRSSAGISSANVKSGENSASLPGGERVPSSTLGSKHASPPWAKAPAAQNGSDTPLTHEERQAIHAKVRLQMKALMAKGSQVSLLDIEAFIDDAEKTGKGVFEPQYFDAMREVVRYTELTQQLSQELGAIAGSSAPRDVARQKMVLIELKEAGNQITSRLALMQSRARESAQSPSR